MYSDRINGYIVIGSRGSSGRVVNCAGETVHAFTGPDSRSQATAAAAALPPGDVPEPAPVPEPSPEPPPKPEPPKIQVPREDQTRVATPPKKKAAKPKTTRHKGAK